MTLHLAVLGSGNAVPTATRGCPGLLLRGGGEALLLDPGPGSLAAAARLGVGPGAVTGVLITHLHLDHHLDLAALLFALHDPRFRGRPPLRVRGPRGLLRVYGLWREAYGKWVEPAGYTLDIEEAGPGPRELGALRLEACEVPHGSTPALGWRIREGGEGPVLAYSGDTGEGPGAAACGREADLFVLECTLPEGEAPLKHLTAAAAGRVAASARCRRLLLVHFSARVDGTPILEAVRAAYGGPVVLATDGYETGV
ncbi:MAG: MBL fold metallo-hydrolase [Planctomycetaceae bacterium]|nr:MBL fold metallo-hydrolase [Planctomycetota bacterium]NUN53492.1 MBL fold metallo-hydrolase [Planctomycetaceae bacterium]